MKHTYTVTGMTCNNCKTKVEDTLQNLPKVDEVSVNLETSQVEITMREHIALNELQEALPDKYNISEKQTKNIFKSAEEAQEKNEWKQLFPLFLIFGYIIVTSYLLNYKAWNLEAFMLDFMGLFYIIFSFFKLLDLKGFPESFKMYDPLAKVVPSYAWIYPFIEVALGIMFLMRFEIPVALLVTIIVLGITTIGVTKVLLDKKAFNVLV